MPHPRRTFLVAGGAAALFAPAWLATPAAAEPAHPRHQSPVHLRVARSRPAPELPDLVVDYPSEITLRVRYVSRDPEGDPSGCGSRGREETVEAEVPAGTAAVHLDDVRYELAQFHFHTPSEHVLDHRRFPLEQHFVHKGPDGQTLVLGLFVDAGGDGGSMQDRVLRRMPVECGEEEHVEGVDVASGLPDDLTTFRYDGSLTTSPYTEHVSWMVLRQPVTIAGETIERFRSLFPKGDARALQPLAGRVVSLHEQG
ncbi:carbonic anhydrase family protein [Actinomycetes bacterium KLBMP 9759]